MKKLVFTALAVVTATAAMAQNLVVNPGFEDNSSGIPTGWTGTQGSFSGVNVTWGTPAVVPHSGTNWYGMGATSAANQTSLSQTIATVAGSMYTVSFWAYENDTTPTGTLNVFFDGVQVHPTGTGYSNVYTQYSANIMASTSSTVLNFQGWEPTTAVVIDDISVVAAVPEPATMAVLGLGALALIRKRRKSA